MPIELLTTVAECAIAFAGFSALIVIIPQLAGLPWRGQMATGLWLMVSWSLTAFVFSWLPLVLSEIGVTEANSLSWSSGLLGVAILVQGGLAARRDWKLAQSGLAHPVEPPVFGAAGLAILVAGLLLLNAVGVLPGAAHGWYLAALLSLFVLAAVPLSIFLGQLGSDRE